MKGENINAYRELHSNNASYGTSSIGYFEEISLIIDYLKPKRILDYGCGKGKLIEALQDKYKDIKIFGYDPAIPEYDCLPVNEQYDLVINTDVLEHIPEEEIQETVKKIKKLSDNVIFCLHHALADAILSDGTNAHCTVKSIFWYNRLFSRYFKDITILDGVEPWQNTVCTFPINTDVYLGYYSIIQKKRHIKNAYLFIKPLYTPLRPILLPFIKFFKKMYLGG